MPDTPETVLIIGIGNALLGDEGLGVHVARKLLEQKALPTQVEVLEAGTALLDFLPEMARYSRVILVDAVRAGREPGTLYRAELVCDSGLELGSNPLLSLHEWGLCETLLVAERLGLLPRRLTLVGAEPESIAPRLELSPVLGRAAEQIVSLLLAEVASQAPGSADVDNSQVAC